MTPNRDEIVALALARRGEMVQVVTAAEVTDLEVAAQDKSFMPRVTTFAFGADIHAHPVPQGISNNEYRPGATGLEMPPSLAGPRLLPRCACPRFEARGRRPSWIRHAT